MLYLMIAFTVLVLFVCFKRETNKTMSTSKISKEDELLIQELDSIKNASVFNFIDENFLINNFELFCNNKFSVIANDEAVISYPLTSLQDTSPLDLA